MMLIIQIMTFLVETFFNYAKERVYVIVITMNFLMNYLSSIWVIFNIIFIFLKQFDFNLSFEMKFLIYPILFNAIFLFLKVNLLFSQSCYPMMYKLIYHILIYILFDGQ